MRIPLLLMLLAPVALADGPVVLSGGLPGSRALVIALHGGSFSGRPPAERAERLLLDLSSESRATGLRLLVPVAPEADRRTAEVYRVPWLAPGGEGLVWALVEQEVEARRADARRIFLVGQGAGATGALTLASRRPELVAGVAAWSGTPEPLWDEQRRVIGLAEPVVAGLRTVPVFLFTARDDPLLDRDTLRLFVEGLAAQQKVAGGPGLTSVEGDGGHGFGSNGPGRGLRFLRDLRHGRQ